MLGVVTEDSGGITVALGPHPGGLGEYGRAQLEHITQRHSVPLQCKPGPARVTFPYVDMLFDARPQRLCSLDSTQARSRLAAARHACLCIAMAENADNASDIMAQMLFPDAYLLEDIEVRSTCPIGWKRLKSLSRSCSMDQSSPRTPSRPSLR